MVDGLGRDERQNANRLIPVPATVFLRRLPATMGHIARQFQWLPLVYIFGVTLFSSDTADVAGDRCVPEIQDGGQITGSTNICETMTKFQQQT